MHHECVCHINTNNTAAQFPKSRLHSIEHPTLLNQTKQRLVYLYQCVSVKSRFYGLMESMEAGGYVLYKIMEIFLPHIF